MKRIKQIIKVWSTMIFFIGCTERVDIDMELTGEPKLAVFAEITDQVKAHAVYLTKSMPYLYNDETPVVTGAAVSISDGTTTINLKEDLNDPGTYYTPENFAGVTGKIYRLNITNLDVNDDGVSESCEAEAAMSGTIPIEGTGVFYNGGWGGWDVTLFASEPGETKDYYLFKVYKNGVLFSDTLSNYRIYDDKFFNGKKLEGVVVQVFNEEKGEIVARGDVVTLEMACITEEYFNFINALKEEIDEKYPMFSGPAANLEGNITNGALGFFSVIDVSRASVTYHGE